MTTKQLIKNLELYDKNKRCSFDVPLHPEEIISWRGVYSEPAILCGLKEYTTTVKDWIEFLSELDGKEVEGYKGGEYILSEDSDLWIVVSDRDSGHTGISHVTCVDDFEVIIHTCHQEY